MPSTFTHSPAETERKEPGIGGKPPVTRRPTGGGGGGGDDDWNNERRKPREKLRRTRFTVFLLLGADLLMYAVLVIVFYAGQASFHIDPRSQEIIGDWHPVGLPPILFINTALLALSSLTMELARRSIFRELDVLEEWLGMGKPALKRALPWLAATLVLGVLFLAGQLVVWSQLTAQGFTWGRLATPPSNFFYILTGFHAAHMVGGVVALIWCLCALGSYKSVERRQIAVDSTAWFWHTTGVVWLMLFAVLAAG
jgi:cytochrome c oxidase subunit 3